MYSVSRPYKQAYAAQYRSYNVIDDILSIFQPQQAEAIVPAVVPTGTVGPSGISTLGKMALTDVLGKGVGETIRQGQTPAGATSLADPEDPVGKIIFAALDWVNRDKKAPWVEGVKKFFRSPVTVYPQSAYAQPGSNWLTPCKACRTGYVSKRTVLGGCYCRQGVSTTGTTTTPTGTKCGTQNGCNEACYKLGNSRYGSGKYRMNPKQTGCNSCSCNFTKCGTQNGCNEACYKLGNSRYGSGKYRMNPKQNGCTNCTCNFTRCGTQNGCNEACYKLGNSRYGSGKYRMSPKQTSCTNCSCNFVKCGTQNGCNEACYKLGNSRYGSGKYRMNPKQTSCTNCSCNFVKCGTQSGCERACPSKSGYTKSPRQVSCTTCYCNYKRSFRCPYSGCSGTSSASQCYLCRCRGICNNSRCGGVRTVSSSGGCWCNKSC